MNIIIEVLHKWIIIQINYKKRLDKNQIINNIQIQCHTSRKNVLDNLKEKKQLKLDEYLAVDLDNIRLLSKTVYSSNMKGS